MTMTTQKCLESAVVIKDGHWVRLEDLLFAQHGLGARYARVITITQQDRELSYAMLNIAGTTYDLITTHDHPRDLGPYEELAGEGPGPALADALTRAFGAARATRQLMALALIKARNSKAEPLDELAMYRIAKWATQYEMRAFWIAKHRIEAYAQDEIQWGRMGM